MSIDDSIKRFRCASRELFNNYFYVADPWNNQDQAWVLKESFRLVEAALFTAPIDPDPVSWPDAPAVREEPPLQPYKNIQPLLHVEIRSPDVPIMINREKEKGSGYWDHPLQRVTSEAVLLFVEFFDWDVLSYIDNKYVRVYIQQWPSHPEAENRYALIEAQYTNFKRVAAAS